MKNEEAKKSEMLKFVKVASLGIAGSLSSIAMVGYAERFLVGGDLRIAWLALLFALAFLVVAAIEAVLVGRVWILIALAFLQAGAPLALFWDKSPLAVAMALLFAFQIVGMSEGRAMLENSLKVKLLQAVKAVIPKVTTGIIMVAAILFYFTYFVWGGWSDEVGRRLTSGLWKEAEPVLNIWIEGARADQTVDEFLRVATEAEIRKLKTKAAKEQSAEFDFDLLAPEEREKRVAEIMGRVKEEMVRVAGPIEGSEKVQDALYRILKARAGAANDASGGLKGFAGILIAVILFGLLKSAAFLVNWIAEIAAVAILKILLALGFAEVSFESASRERIEL